MDARNNQFPKTIGKGNAGKNGIAFERIVCLLQKLGFKYYEYNDIPNELPPRYIMHSVPYNSLLKQKADEYGIPKKQGISRTEFVIVAKDAISTPEFPINGELTIRIECKWQEVSGTTSQKLMHAVADLQYGAPEKNIILLMDGDGFDEITHRFIQEICEDGLTWKHAPKIPLKNIRKMRLVEFIDWGNRAFG